MTPDDLWIEMAQFDDAHADRLWEGSAATEDAPAWYGRVATLLRTSAEPATDDELAGESDIVARMQAAILEPATHDELAGESDIVARMRATILQLARAADGDDAGDADRPRHLRAATPSAHGARRRQGVRVVRRVVAVKAAAVTTVVALGVTAAAATTGIVTTVLMPALSDRAHKVFPGGDTPQPADSGSWTDGSGGNDGGVGDDGGDDAVVTMDPEEPLVCMLDLDCLMREVKVAAAADPPVPAPGTLAADGAAPVDDVVDPSSLAEPPPPETPPVTIAVGEPPVEPATTTTTTTTPPPTTTTSAPPPPSTTTTQPPPPPPPGGEAALPAAPEVEPLSAPTGETGGAEDAAGATATTLTVDAGAGSGAAPQPAS
ncbi:MAG: hypothetical protein ACRD07_04780 [Acidimicrobiales bacterium]